MAGKDENDNPQADDALLWGGEVDDPTYLDGKPRTAEPRSKAAVQRDADGGEPAKSGTNPFLTYAYGLFGGIFVLYAIGWVLALQRDTFSAPDILSRVMYQVGEYLAILAPVIWVALTFLLTRHSRPILRLLWLIGGVLLLAPWPFILPAQGAAG